ncbi:hypothetical protein B6264_18875 [Kitasatospora aureofaciens]|nr:hypothetical protein B6264_18875 [Kitasatospora aureofaciens]
MSGLDGRRPGHDRDAHLALLRLVRLHRVRGADPAEEVDGQLVAAVQPVADRRPHIGVGRPGTGRIRLTGRDPVGRGSGRRRGPPGSGLGRGRGPARRRLTRRARRRGPPGRRTGGRRGRRGGARRGRGARGGRRGARRRVPGTLAAPVAAGQGHHRRQCGDRQGNHPPTAAGHRLQIHLHILPRAQRRRPGRSARM